MTHYSIPPLPVLDIGRPKSSAVPLPSLLDMPHQLLTQGRNAIWWALELSGVGQGAGVLMPAYHCPTMVAPAVALGAQVYYYDIRPDGSPDPDSLDAAADAGAIKAMLVVHYFGLPLDLQPVRAFCDRHNISMIEDCSHAFFGACKGVAVGTLGDYAIGSIPKFFSASEGGVLASQRQPLQLADRIAASKPLAAARDLFNIVDNANIHGRLGWLRPLGSLLNALKALKRSAAAPAAQGVSAGSPTLADRMSVFNVSSTTSGLGLVTQLVLKHIDPGLDARRENFQALVSALADVPGCMPLRAGLPAESAPYVFPLWIDGDASAVAKALRSMGIPCYQWNDLWPGTPQHANPVAQSWSDHVIQIPCHQSIIGTDIATMRSAITHCIGRHS